MKGAWQCGQFSSKPHQSILPSQVFGLLAKIAVERGDLEVALDLAHRALQEARELHLKHPVGAQHVIKCLLLEANILQSLGRLDQAIALDREYLALPDLQPADTYRDLGPLVRYAIVHMAAGNDAEAEALLRRCLVVNTHKWPKLTSRSMVEDTLQAPHRAGGAA
jgi:tetratricopeptide (TPR) repeat protein